MLSPPPTAAGTRRPAPPRRSAWRRRNDRDSRFAAGSPRPRGRASPTTMPSGPKPSITVPSPSFHRMRPSAMAGARTGSRRVSSKYHLFRNEQIDRVERLGHLPGNLRPPDIGKPGEADAQQPDGQAAASIPRTAHVPRPRRCRDRTAPGSNRPRSPRAPRRRTSRKPIKPAKTAPSASTTSGQIITGGDSWTWLITSRDGARGLPWKVRNNSRQE